MMILGIIGIILVSILLQRYMSKSMDFSVLGFANNTNGGNSNSHHLTNGYDIKLKGSIVDEEIVSKTTGAYAINPLDFRGLKPIPKVIVEVGDKVKAGDVLFYDKVLDEIKFVAPVSGEVIEVRRGEKRRIEEIIVLADKEIDYKNLNAPKLENSSIEEIRDFLLANGGWTLINERPFDKLADLERLPDNIFISTFDTAPLAPKADILIKGKEAEFEKGLEVLSKLTKGKVYLGVSAKQSSEIFSNANHCVKHYFHGSHPCGNVGIQIHHIKPINSGDMVWTLDVQGVATIGGMFLNDKFDSSRVVALVGDPVLKPKYINTYLGASIKQLLDEEFTNSNIRIVAGDVLSGQGIAIDGFLKYGSDQITLIKEGDYYEMFGWLLPGKARPSVSPTLGIFGAKEYIADTNTHGESRAFVVTGQYEDLLPMDIYPQHLMKSIIYSDVEEMEKLGILELSEEDIALCEFACTSKQPLQTILRNGLDLMQAQ